MLSPHVAAQEVTREKLREQIQNLSNPSYRTRQMALWYLEQHPKAALPLLKEAGKSTDINIGAEIIAMLSTQAMMPDSEISIGAHEALKEIAGGSQSVTANSHMAISALEAIADRQEILAQQTLETMGVHLGPLRLNINGVPQNEMGHSPDFIVHVDDEFHGRTSELRLFRFLKSYSTAYLEGPAVTPALLREVMAMPNLKRIVLKGPAINNELLNVLFDGKEIEHLELIYAGVDDGAVPTIVDLPLVGSLRIFGTKVSGDGARQIKKALEGLDIYFGRGGFLGVKTNMSNLVVSSVVADSGAARGGIQPLDTITHINDKPIKTFPQLREELSNFAPGDKVSVIVDRPVIGTQRRETIQLDIVLGKQETPSS